MRHRSAVLGFSFLIAICLTLTCYGSKQFVMPTALAAQSYAAHDIHNDEHVSIGADPYDNDEKTKIFNQKYAENGYLPIFVVVTNDGDQPVSVSDMRLELVTANKTKLLPATLDDLYRRFSKVTRRGDEPRRNPLPVPLPKKGPETGVKPGAIGEFEAAMFQAHAVEPHSSQSGFFFFDVEGISQPLAGAHLYVTRVNNNDGQELMYFDLPMDKSLAAQ